VYIEQYIDQTYTQVGSRTHAGHTYTHTLLASALKGLSNLINTPMKYMALLKGTVG